MDIAHYDNSSDSQSDETAGVSAGKTNRILIVEDNHLNKKLFRDLLRAKGHEIFEAGDGDEGIEMARSLKPDLVLLDIQLPTVSGLDVAKAMKADPSLDDIPLIAVTAFAMDGDEDMTRDSGCDGYLTKPISITNFIETVERFLCPLETDAART
jgi:two-component system, cell cycle response regulator DivK